MFKKYCFEKKQPVHATSIDLAASINSFLLTGPCQHTYRDLVSKIELALSDFQMQ
jgi:hypothetical protein